MSKLTGRRIENTYYKLLQIDHIDGDGQGDGVVMQNGLGDPITGSINVSGSFHITGSATIRKDLRVLVVNGKVVGCMMRQSVDGDFRANITRGGEAIPYQVDEDIEWIAGECSRLLNLDIAGVDLLFNEGSYTICEVNSAPGFEGMEKFTKVNVGEKIVNYVVKKIGS